MTDSSPGAALPLQHFDDSPQAPSRHGRIPPSRHGGPGEGLPEGQVGAAVVGNGARRPEDLQTGVSDSDVSGTATTCIGSRVDSQLAARRREDLRRTRAASRRRIAVSDALRVRRQGM